MTLPDALALIFTLLASVSIVAAIILLGWFLIWKAFLSKFLLVRELIGQGEDDEPQQQLAGGPRENQQLQEGHAKPRKVRRD